MGKSGRFPSKGKQRGHQSCCSTAESLEDCLGCQFSKSREVEDRPHSQGDWWREGGGIDGHREWDAEKGQKGQQDKYLVIK